MERASSPPGSLDVARRLRIAMLTESQPASNDEAASDVHLCRLILELSRIGHSVDLFTAKHALLARAGYDIVHAHSVGAGMAALRMCRKNGLPYVLTMAEAGISCRPRAGPAREGEEGEAEVLREASLILSPCTDCSRRLEHLHHIPARRIASALRAYAPEELWPAPMEDARSRLGLDRAPFLVLHLGRIAPRKGIDTLIQGVALLRQRYAIDAGLLVVGGGRPGEPIESARLAHLAAELGVAKQVHFVGAQPRSSLRDFFAAANVFAATPWHEPVGMTPIEAMACARPVIASELGAIGELVDDGKTGFLIPSRDPEALATRLAWLHRHPLLAHAMGEAGRRHAGRHYSWQRQTVRLLELYRSVLHDVHRPAHSLNF